jgi:membrane-bound lytic murein transglycosylase A
MGVPLTPGRSLAVDTDYLPLGALLWLETKQYNGAELNKLVIAQDVGSAIKGAIRGDYFYGSGGDDILEKAGKMNSKGRYFVLIPHHYQENEHD